MRRVGDGRALHGDRPREGEVDIIDAGLRIIQSIEPGFRARFEGMASDGLGEVPVEVIDIFAADDEGEPPGAHRLVALGRELRGNGRIPWPLKVEGGGVEGAFRLAWQRGVSELPGPAPTQT